MPHHRVLSSRPSMGAEMKTHPNGFLPIKSMSEGETAWNLRPCPECGAPMDYRANKCRACFLAMAPTKVCTGCKNNLPRTEYYHRKNGYILPICKECTSAQGRARDRAIVRQRARIRTTTPTAKRKRVEALMLRQKRDLNFRIRVNLTKALWNALRRSSAPKSDRTLALLGCSIAEFRAHIEAQWSQGMGWENWGRGPGSWQLDHIRPLASFDLVDELQQRECFHFTNYQPLWSLENSTKRAHWNGVDYAAIALRDFNKKRRAAKQIAHGPSWSGRRGNAH